MRKPIAVNFHEVGEVADTLLKYAVIVVRCKNKYIFCRHKDRETYEIPGGRREKGETIDETAKRELWEETGAYRYSLAAVCLYSVVWDDGPSYAKLYFAEGFEFKPLPEESEIFEISNFEHLPINLTYPAIQPALFEKVLEWLINQN